MSKKQIKYYCEFEFQTVYIINVKNYKLIPHLKDVWNCKSGKSSYAGLNYSANYQVNRLMMVYWYWDPLNCLTLGLPVFQSLYACGFFLKSKHLLYYYRYIIFTCRHVIADGESNPGVFCCWSLPSVTVCDILTDRDHTCCVDKG